MPPPAIRLTWAQVIAWRAARHGLDRRVPRSEMLAMARRLCGLHAQLMSSAELTLWARVDDFEPTAVASALWQDRTLVKTWAMRGTLHLLPAADFPVWRAGFGTYRHYLKPSWFKGFGLTREELEQLVAAIVEALDKEPLTREELADAVARITGLPDMRDKVLGSWGSFLKPAAFQGHLCFGPSTGQNVRFTRPDRWLGPMEPVPPDEATLTIARWFLGGHGPTGRDDYARWWFMSPAQALAVLKRLGDEVVEVDIEGYPAWMLRDHVGEVRAARRIKSVRLLPAFDQYVIAATRHVAHLLPEGGGGLAARVYRPQGWLSPVLLVDGRMVGVWKHERKGRRVDVSIEPFIPVKPAVKKAAEEEAERLGAFLGGTTGVSWEL